jgi:hypothetical protein
MKRKVIALGVLGALCVAGVVATLYYARRMPSDLVVKGLHPSIMLLDWRDQNGKPICTNVQHCGEYVRVSCTPQPDRVVAPVGYFNNTTGVRECARPLLPYQVDRSEVCPPKEWTCGQLTAP